MQNIFLKKFHVSEKVSHVRSSNCTHITITMQSKQSTEEKKNSRHLTLVYMRHVTFTLIVESENINSIRALCFDACFQHTKKPIVRIEMFHPPKIYSDSLQHENHQFQKHSSESSEIKKKHRENRDEFGA